MDRFSDRSRTRNDFNNFTPAERQEYDLQGRLLIASFNNGNNTVSAKDLATLRSQREALTPYIDLGRDEWQRRADAGDAHAQDAVRTMGKYEQQETLRAQAQHAGLERWDAGPVPFNGPEPDLAPKTPDHIRQEVEAMTSPRDIAGLLRSEPFHDQQIAHYTQMLASRTPSEEVSRGDGRNLLVAPSRDNPGSNPAFDEMLRRGHTRETERESGHGLNSAPPIQHEQDIQRR